MDKTKLVFFDDYWLDFRTGTVRRWFQPEWLGEFGGGSGTAFYWYGSMREREKPN